MGLKEKYGSTALICGASEGIGAAFAEYMAAESLDLILVARRLQPLEKLAEQIRNKYGVNVIVHSIDLSANDATATLIRELNGREPGLVVYNAALSFVTPFTSQTTENYLKALRVNMITPLELIHHFGQSMISAKKGGIIVMSSMAGMQGSGFLAVYAATKAFLRIFSESLWYEWKEKGVDVITCVAGATSTPGYIESRPVKTSAFAPRVLSPEEIPIECFRRLGKKPSFITGRANRIASFFMQRLLPRKRAIKIMGDNTRKMYRL